MKIWKIEHSNKSLEGAKIAISISSDESKGIILKPQEFVLAQEQQTASLDSQSRRGFIQISSFDNSKLNLKLGEAYNISILETKEEQKIEEPLPETTESNEVNSLTKFEEAEKNASDYINNKTEE